MFVPDYARKCVCFLGVKSNPDKEPALGGSVFFVGITLPGTEHFAVYALTARHCIEETKQRSCDAKVHLRLNIRTRGAQFFDTAINQWFFHPEKDRIDVAVLPMCIPADWDHLFLSDSSFATPSAREECEVGLGDELFFVGLFKSHYGAKNNIPIVRVGNIAAMPSDPVRGKKWPPMDAFLVEARSIGGLSGSPVFVPIDPHVGAPAGLFLKTTG